jgi:hypothetical protein
MAKFLFAAAAKAADVVGLYMAPPENAMVICVNEKPPIQVPRHPPCQPEQRRPVPARRQLAPGL